MDVTYQMTKVKVIWFLLLPHALGNLSIIAKPDGKLVN